MAVWETVRGASFLDQVPIALKSIAKSMEMHNTLLKEQNTLLRERNEILRNIAGDNGVVSIDAVRDFFVK